MRKVLLFDIDKTLFDRESYLNDFWSILVSEFEFTKDELANVMKLYEDIKKENNYFAVNEFVEKIYKYYPKTDKNLDYYFENENIARYVFHDTKVLFEIKDFEIGIFSKGDKDFQKIKIDKFKKIFDKNLFYIYRNKIKNIPEIIKNHKNDLLFVVDDDVDALKSFKSFKKDVKTILIDRDNNYKKELNGVDFRIISLFDIISILK